MNAVKDKSGLNGQQVLSMKATLAAEKFAARTRTTKFPQARLSENWKDLAEKAITKCPPLYIRLSLKEFNEVFSADVDDVNFFEFGCLSNAIETLSFEDSGMTEDQYKDTLAEAVLHIEHYNLEINKMKAAIEKEVDREVSMKVAAMAGAESGILDPVKAEA